MVLSMKALKYDYVAMPLLQKAQTTSEFTEKNPMQQIPTLEVKHSGPEPQKSTFISESMAIMDYLDYKYPQGPSIYPKGTSSSV